LLIDDEEIHDVVIENEMRWNNFVVVVDVAVVVLISFDFF